MKTFIRAIFYIFLAAFFFVLPGFAQVPPPSSGQPDFSVLEEFSKDSKLELPGVTCGVAKSREGDPSPDRCCKFASIKTKEEIEKISVDAVVQKMASPPGGLNNLSRGDPEKNEPDELNFVQSVASTLEEQGALFAVFSERMRDIIDRSAAGEALSGDEQNFLREVFIAYIDKVKKEDPNPLKERVRKLIDPDKCLINTRIVKGFCLRGIMESIVGDIIGNLPGVKSMIKVYEEAPAEGCVSGEPEPGINDQNCRCVYRDAISQLCSSYIQDPDELLACDKCNKPQEKGGLGGVWTSVGCLRANFAGFVQDILISVGLGVAGITALLCIIYSAFLLQTSRGNPEQIKKAREYLTNCIIGLLLIIFSVFILRFIGVNLLGIPGFG